MCRKYALNAASPERVSRTVVRVRRLTKAFSTDTKPAASSFDKWLDKLPFVVPMASVRVMKSALPAVLKYARTPKRMRP